MKGSWSLLGCIIGVIPLGPPLGFVFIPLRVAGWSFSAQEGQEAP